MSLIADGTVQDRATKIGDEFRELIRLIKQGRPETFDYRDAWAIAAYSKLAELELRIEKLEAK